MTIKNPEHMSEFADNKRAFMVGAAHALWVVVADGAVAKVFAPYEGHFDLIHEIKQPDMMVDGMDNDGRGRGGFYGRGRHAYDPTMEESRQEEMALAREVATWLDLKFSQERFKTLVLVAAPQMLGELRKNLSRQVIKAVIAESHKQLTGHSGDQLAKELTAIIPGPDKE